MRSKTASVLVAILISARSACAETATVDEQARALRDGALQDTTAYSIIRDLTTLFGARPAGSRAERAAADWTAKTMTDFGLKNVRIDRFPIVEWRRGVERAEIVGERPQSLAVTSLGGTDPTPAEGVEGEVVIFPTMDDLVAAAQGSLRGKVAMLDYQMPRLESGLGYVIATDGRGRGPGEAAKRGAIAFVMRSAGTGRHRLPHTGSTRFVDGRVPIPSFALSAADADQIARLAAHGSVRLRLHSSGRMVGEGESQNVVGEVPGRIADDIVLIGAHLDSWDLGTGAVDDAAGVGIVLAAARRIASLPVKPKRTIRVVLFGAEEIAQPREPLFIVGGNMYATKYSGEKKNHFIAGESDLGAGRIFSLALPPGWANSELGSRLARLLLPLGILIDGQPAPHGGADMFPMQAAGVPVFLFYQDAAEYFDLHHTADDTFDKIDLRNIQQNVAAWTTVIWMLAEAEK